jgi:hypothetical protein
MQGAILLGSFDSGSLSSRAYILSREEITSAYHGYLMWSVVITTDNKTPPTKVSIVADWGKQSKSKTATDMPLDMIFGRTEQELFLLGYQPDGVLLSVVSAATGNIRKTFKFPSTGHDSCQLSQGTFSTEQVIAVSCSKFGNAKRYGRVIGTLGTSSDAIFNTNGDYWTDNIVSNRLLIGSRLSSKDILLLLSFDSSTNIVSL